ncbi:MAG: ion channel [Acidobacteriota bacterium]|nr:ion channel [Acidobacteriota bacterium]
MSSTPSSLPAVSDRPLDRDLGFGSLAEHAHYRLLNRNGTFNVHRAQSSWFECLFAYHALVNMPWLNFFLLLGAWYAAINAIFALGYLALGAHALAGSFNGPLFWRAFFFSIHTFATVGYGNIVPVTMAANVLVAVQALFGLLSLAVATGLVFARFSRPNARVLYSRKALIAPYRDITSFQFRVVNQRRSQLMHVGAQVIHSRFEPSAGGRVRRFYPLDLERTSVALFPTNWTVVHPITPGSPLHGWTREQLIDAEAEFIVLLNAVEETYAQTVYSRTSYSAREIDWGRKFSMMYFEENGRTRLDLERLDDTHAAPLPGPTALRQPADSAAAGGAQ